MYRLLSLSAVLWCAACVDGEKDPDTGDTDTGTDIVDADGDGFAEEDDCDDTNAAINPDAVEVCDGVDNNCDALIDDDDSGLDTTTATSWYGDADGDGYGDDAAEAVACEQPDGAVSEGGDCADDDKAISPAAAEVCDDVDNDCDALIDDDDDDVDPKSQDRYYADGDADGYGDVLDKGTLACDDPTTKDAAYTLDQSDCDDASADINPAAAEVCNGADDDCDSATGEEGTASFYADAGTVADVTKALGAGSAKASVLWTSTESGTLNICEGTWYARLDLQHDVSVYGAGSASTTLDAALGGAVVFTDVDGISVSAEGLTLTNGSGGTTDLGGTYAVGGGILCDGALTMSLVDIVSTAHSASLGGGAYVGGGCEVTADNVELSYSSGIAGIGLMVLDGDVELSSSLVTGNSSSGFGAGIYAGLGGDVTLDLIDTLVEDNVAENSGGGMYVNTEPTVLLSCTGSTKTTAGFLSNSSDDSGGGIYLGGTLDSKSSFVATDCDFGTTSADNNSPDDVATVIGDTLTYGDDASFTCTASGCK